MVEPEEDGQEHGKGKGQEDVSSTQVPETHEPGAVGGGHEGNGCREHLNVDRSHAANVDEAGEEDEGQGCTVVFEEDAHVVVEESAGAEFAAGIGDHEEEQGGDDG